ncbi:ATP-binding cassette domain-containing protein [Mycoplasmatota bacterium]|nr:ATP-binding cassette domain-containing protein [Mycoplasmatota bacterium]
MIQFKDINLQFNNKQVFNDFNLTINEKDKILLSAPSGSGKTSLVKMLLGIIRYEGDILLKNQLLTPSTRNFFRKNISYVSQDVDLQNLKTNDLINEILSYKVNKHISYNQKLILQLFHQFNLNNEHLEKQVHDLSGGERARVGFIIALLLDRDILILDEITAGLDEKLKRKIIDYTCHLDKTIIIISHDSLWKEAEKIRLVEWNNE